MTGLLAEAEELLQETVAMALPFASGTESATWATSKDIGRTTTAATTSGKGETVGAARPARAAELWLGRRWGTSELSARLEEVCRELDSVATLCGGG